jgi:hypothetical protein
MFYSEYGALGQAPSHGTPKVIPDPEKRLSPVFGAIALATAAHFQKCSVQLKDA